MKQKFLERSLLMTLCGLAVLLCTYACKKDKLTEPPIIDKEIVIPSKTQLVIQRIKNFDDDLKSIKQGYAKGDDYVHIDTALWNIESLFNVSYSFPDNLYKSKKIQELDFTVNVCANGMLMMSDVNSLYDEIVATLREAYRNDGYIEDKSLMSIMIKKGELSSNKLNVKVTLVTGQKTAEPGDLKPVLNGPFKEGDNYYFGEYGGSCTDGTVEMTDAAELLEDTINYYYSWRPKEPDPIRAIYVNIAMIGVDPTEYYDVNNNSYYIYYHVNPADSVLCLDHTELNKYYNNELKVIFNFVPNDPYYIPQLPENPHFMEVYIDGLSLYDDNGRICYHANTIIYGTQHVIFEYDLGVPKDLLND